MTSVILRIQLQVDLFQSWYMSHSNFWEPWGWESCQPLSGTMESRGHLHTQSIMSEEVCCVCPRKLEVASHCPPYLGRWETGLCRSYSSQKSFNSFRLTLKIMSWNESSSKRVLKNFNSNKTQLTAKIFNSFSNLRIGIGEWKERTPK